MLSHPSVVEDKFWLYRCVKSQLLEEVAYEIVKCFGLKNKILKNIYNGHRELRDIYPPHCSYII